MTFADSYTLVAPFIFMNILSHIPWTFVFLFTPYLFGVRLYFLQKRDECSRIQKRVQHRCSHTTDGGKGYGYAIGMWYVANIHIISNEYGDTYSIYLIATASSFKALTQDAEDAFLGQVDCEDGTMLPTIENKKTAIFDRKGSYANPWFTRRLRDAADTPMGQQASVMEALIDHQKKCRHTVAYIHGPPGTGKSMMGILIANEMNAGFCNTLKPWQPGDTLGTICLEAEPSPTKPLIIVIDEFDSILEKIHAGIEPHKNMPIATPDKQGWNHMLDEIQRGMYPDLMLILTSNKGPDYIRSLDPSYIRKGRIDLTFEMTESLIEI